MKKVLLAIGIGTMLFTACADNTSNTDTAAAETPADQNDENKDNSSVTPSMFGEEITIEEVTSSDDLFAKLGEMDTVSNIVVSGTINTCCQKKGCWMKVQLADEKEVFVKFKDYGFFMPLDCSGSTAVMQGKAYSDTISVEELQHYAKDAGKSEEEIAAITDPEIKYSFMADGVILKDYVHKDEEEANQEEHSHEGHDHGDHEH